MRTLKYIVAAWILVAFQIVLLVIAPSLTGVVWTIITLALAVFATAAA
jgi:putative exporter of polyketide antibiotics